MGRLRGPSIAARTAVAVLCCMALASCGPPAAPLDPPAAPPTTSTASPGDAYPTAEEIRRLAAGTDGGTDPRVVPRRYDVTLRIDPDDDAGYRGTVDIELEVVADAPIDRFPLFACDTLALGSVRVDGSDARVEHTGPACRVDISPAHPLRAGTHHLSVAFTAPWGLDRGIFRFEVDGRRYVASHMGEGYTREALPCFDEPAFKAPLAMTIEAPDGLVVVANGAPLHDATETRDAPGVTTHRFASTPPMATYLFALAVGPWDVHEATADDHAPPVRVLTTRARDGWQHAVERAPVILAAVERWAGSPYPFARLDIIAVDGLGTLAMENPGLVMVKASALLLDAGESAAEDHRYVDWILAHELAHMWFGDLVTMAWWDDLWLNESLATWLGARITAEVDPGDYEQALVDLRDRHAMFADDVWPVRPIRAPVAPVGAEIEAAFALQTYFKGAAVLATLEAWLGPDTLRDALRDYLAGHAWGSATRDDFLAAVAPALPDERRLADVLDGYLDQPGVPRVDLDWRCQAPGRVELEARIGRHVPLGAELDTSGTWQVPACLRLGDDEGASTRHCAVLTDAATVTLELDACPSWLHPSADEVGYYRWTLADGALAALLEHGVGHLSDVELAALPEQLWGAFEAGRLEAGVLLEAYVQSGIARPSSPSLAIALVSRLEDLAVTGAVDPEVLRARAATLLASLEQGLDPVRGDRADEAREAIADARLRIVGDDAVAHAALDELQGFLEHGSEASTDWPTTTRTLRRAARVADTGFTDVLVERYGPVCGDWFGSVFAHLRGAPLTAAADHLVEQCVPMSEGFLVTLRHNPEGAATLYTHLTERLAEPDGVLGQFAGASLAVHAAAAACVEPSSVRAWLTGLGLDPDDTRLARPLAEAARCAALSGR